VSNARPAAPGSAPSSRERGVAEAPRCVPPRQRLGGEFIGPGAGRRKKPRRLPNRGPARPVPADGSRPSRITDGWWAPARPRQEPTLAPDRGRQANLGVNFPLPQLGPGDPSKKKAKKGRTWRRLASPT